MRHLTEEELIDHYCAGKQRSANEDRERAGAAQHIGECAECGASYTALEADLSDLAESAPPYRDAEYGERVWDAVAGLLPEKPASKHLWIQPALWRGLAYVSAAALLLAVTFYGGREWERAKAPVTANKTLAPAQAPKRVVVVVLSDHLERTERLLVELKHTGAADQDMLPPLRDEARNLLPANRICMHDARVKDDPEHRKALADLDSLLSKLADQPDGMDPAEIARLQKQMKADGLLFEVRVLRSRMPETEQAKGTLSEGGEI